VFLFPANQANTQLPKCTLDCSHAYFTSYKSDVAHIAGLTQKLCVVQKVQLEVLVSVSVNMHRKAALCYVKTGATGAGNQAEVWTLPPLWLLPQ